MANQSLASESTPSSPSGRGESSFAGLAENRRARAENLAFVGRQAIYQPDLEIYGYELLYRSAGAQHARIEDGTRATSEVLLSVFMDIGLDRIAGPYTPFINFTKNLLGNPDLLPFPPGSVVLEILEDVEVDTSLVEAVRNLHTLGHRIALDDFVLDPCWEPLMPYVEIVKIDVLSLTLTEVQVQVDNLRRQNVTLLAEKVETLAEFQELKAMGFELFQGYFLSRPQVLSETRLAGNKLATMRLLGALQNPSAEITDIELLVSQDVPLSYKLLRYINSVHVGLPRKVASLRDAVVYLGVDAIRRWAMLATLNDADDKPHDLLVTALSRARCCEMLCEKARVSNRHTGFTVGLFSAVDALLDIPMAELLGNLPLADDLNAAILEHQGPAGEVLSCTLAYEQCRWQDVVLAPLNAAEIRDIYLDAIQWAASTGQSMKG